MLVSGVVSSSLPSVERFYGGEILRRRKRKNYTCLCLPNIWGGGFGILVDLRIPISGGRDFQSATSLEATYIVRRRIATPCVAPPIPLQAT